MHFARSWDELFGGGGVGTCVGLLPARSSKSPQNAPCAFDVAAIAATAAAAAVVVLFRVQIPESCDHPLSSLMHYFVWQHSAVITSR